MSKNNTSEYKSFRCSSESSLRNLPLYLIVFMIISLFNIICGLVLEFINDFWQGLINGIIFGFASVLLILKVIDSKEKVDTSSFPEPSEKIKVMLSEPNYALANVVAEYMKETGSTLTEAAAVIKEHIRKEYQ